MKRPALAFVLMALAACSPAAQRKQETPLSQRQVAGLVEGGVYSGRIARLVEERGINFKPTGSYLLTLREDGAEEVLIRALLAAKLLTPAPPPAPRAETHAQASLGPDTATGARLAHCLAIAGQFERQKMWPQAEQQYRVALGIQPHSASICRALGRTLAAENQPKEAIAEYRQAISLQPDLARSHRELGDLLTKTGDFNGGIAEYREALRLNANDAELLQKLAALLYSRGYLEAAVTAYRALEALQPNRPEVHYGLGLALYDESDLAAAADEFRQALRLEPGFRQAHAALGDALLKEGDRHGALEEYRKAAGPGNPTLNDTFQWLSKNRAH